MPTQIFITCTDTHPDDGHFSGARSRDVAAGQWHHNPPWDQGPPNSLKLRA